MTRQKSIEASIAFVKQHLNDAEAGHDWWHIQRVWSLTKTIAKLENCNTHIAELGALFHDIADTKFKEYKDEDGSIITSQFLESIDQPKEVINSVIYIINNISFRANIDHSPQISPELAVVMDADRLDAMGAIGIARAFSYGAHKNRPFYDPEQKPRNILTKNEYEKRDGSTINHFYEKLLLLKDKMNTSTGKKMAEQRHRYMLEYLQQFLSEFNGSF